jgi:hypothetical protein
MICGSARVSKDKGALRPLVTDLYLSEIDPSMATEALILGDCGSLSAIVREMVAQGGDQAVAGVVGRALFLSGPGAENLIESAASAGLERNLGMAALAPLAAAQAGPAAAASSSGSLAFAMAYFPSQAPEPGLETSKTAKTLYSNATPGYGIYTFVLLGGGFDRKSQAEESHFAELLRVIETYVLAADKGTRGPSPESHAFLVAVPPDRSDQPLMRQTSPELSAPMRKDLARYLRQQGQTALAERLETRPGPFLISSLEPMLTPTNRVAPRLVVDLSLVGPEYMYAIVDAYDQPIPVERSGRPESLTLIRNRLLGLFSRKAPEEDLDATLKDAWVFRLGGTSATADGAESSGSAPTDSQARSESKPAPANSSGASSAPETQASQAKTQADSGSRSAVGRPGPASDVKQSAGSETKNDSKPANGADARTPTQAAPPQSKKSAEPFAP